MIPDKGLYIKQGNQLFNGVKLFQNEIDLAIEPKSVTLLYGKSGTGKSAIFDMFTYLVPPHVGEVYWDGEKIESLQQANRIRSKLMGVIFSDFTFISMLSVKENLLLPASLCGIKNIPQRLEQIYEEIFRFDGEESNIDLQFLLTKKHIQALSNGQKEIIMMASILMLDSKYLIADEMLRSFPDETQEKIFKRILRYIKTKDTGMFYISHWKEAVDILKQENIKQTCYKIADKKLVLCDHKGEI